MTIILFVFLSNNKNKTDTISLFSQMMDSSHRRQGLLRPPRNITSTSTTTTTKTTMTTTTSTGAKTTTTMNSKARGSPPTDAFFIDLRQTNSVPLVTIFIRHYLKMMYIQFYCCFYCCFYYCYYR